MFGWVCEERAGRHSGRDILLNKSETKIVTEQHYLEGTTTKEMIVEVLTLLCSVPENKELKATLPVELISSIIHWMEGRLQSP